MAGAVSGNGTQNPTSVDTPAELEGTVDTGFESGDRAYVRSLAPNGRFYLDRDSVAVVDNVSVIATWSSLGRWLTEGASSVAGALFTDNQPVTAPGQVAFVLPSVPTGNVIMFVNGVQYREGVDYTVVGVNVTWLDVPFVLAITDTVTFAYN